MKKIFIFIIIFFAISCKKDDLTQKGVSVSHNRYKVVLAIDSLYNNFTYLNGDIIVQIPKQTSENKTIFNYSSFKILKQTGLNDSLSFSLKYDLIPKFNINFITTPDPNGGEPDWSHISIKIYRNDSLKYDHTETIGYFNCDIDLQ